MSKVKKVMKKMRLRYFSELTSLQKNEVYINISILKNKLSALPKGLAIEILKNRPFDVAINENEKIDNQIKGQKFSYYEPLNCWLPLNINQILTNEK